MVRGRSLAYCAQLPCNNLRLPFRVEGDTEDRFTPITQELQNGQRSLRSFIASSERFDE